MILNILKDPAVIAAAIQSAGGIIAAVVAAIAVAIIGKQFANRKHLQEKLLLVQQDLVFLLAVEEAHCELHIKISGESFKRRMRQVATNRALNWSGKFTPGRVKDSPTFQKAIKACSS